MSDEQSPSMESGKIEPRIVAALLLLVMVAAAVIRISDLGDHPPGLFCDEAAMGYNSFAIAEAGISESKDEWPLFFWSFGGYKNPTYIYPGALAVKIFGLSEFSTRLPAALFGIASVLIIFFIGRAMVGMWTGLWAAIFLCFMPWHIHFSRIAFELISFGFLFLATLWMLLEYTRGKRTLPVAAALAASCLYAYAIAAVFVPLFIAGFAVLYFPELLRRWAQTLIAVVIGLACVYPILHFYENTPRAWTYAKNTRWFQVEVPEEGTLPERVESVVRQATEQWPKYKDYYAKFFSDRFLLQHGDRITRHSVRDHGELLPLWIETEEPVSIPWVGTISSPPDGLSGFKLLVGLGALICLFWPNRRTKLALLWLLLFPAGAALMKEVPSATRSFIGTGAFSLLAAVGLCGILGALGFVVRKRAFALPVQIAVTAAFLAWLFVPGVRHYLHLYFDVYPTYAAPSPGGYQYGYGPAIEYMESVRDQYDLMMISTSDTNQPTIFPLFYRKLDPTGGRSPKDLGYLVLDPAEYRRYDMSKRILYALRRRDLRFFNEYEIKKTIVAPGGQEIFLIAEVLERKRYLNQWLTLGPFPNEDNKGITRDFIPLDRFSMKTIVNSDGERVTWRRIGQQFMRTNLNDFYRFRLNGPVRNPERVCAYALTTLNSNRGGDVFLEIAGSDIIRAWLNGSPITKAPLVLKENPVRRKIRLRKGENPLLVQSCEEIGHWYFEARITDAEGNDVRHVRALAQLPTRERITPQPTDEPDEGDSSALQVVQGFGKILSYQHTQENYADYRGGTRSWWAYANDREPTLIWHTPPVPAPRKTAAVFTASTGGKPGRAELWVDGQRVLDFDLGQQLDSATWSEGDWELRYIRKQLVAGSSGYFVLLVPAWAVTENQPLEIRIAVVTSKQNSWFMLKNYKDTPDFEQLSARSILRGTASDWMPVDGEDADHPS